ncbi:UvrD-helicase domain-containing protein [Magnetococcales bacterium HHB-1]
MMAPKDAAARKEALDITQSFIVQAPAGSGKTGLLTQRFLALLAYAENPEEISAITFTRKAAAEMRGRIIEALEQAEKGVVADSDHQAVTLKLAQAVLRRDREKDWQIILSPARLRISTIDGLCASITRQMPITSGFGAHPAVSEDPQLLYMAAAAAVLREIDLDDPHDPAWILLDHLDNNLPRAERLLADMLAKRDQWLRPLLHSKGLSKALLEHNLQQAILARLHALSSLFSETMRARILSLAHFAANQLITDEPDHPLKAWQAPHLDFPTAKIEDFSLWKGLAELLLTAAGAWRKQVTKKQGFPAPSSARRKEDKDLYAFMKAEMKEVLSDLSEEETLAQQLAHVRILPEPHYNATQWQVLETLQQLLPRAVAYLRLLFQEQGEVDFTEISLAALQSLGDPDQPSDLALKLDYTIQHLLVDEFQDTSVTQFQLLEKLTAGWTVDDGRTLFLVGDPMQSIYRFRQADVGLFLRAQNEGVGPIKPKSLYLTVNFRSHGAVVSWINETFQQILPSAADYTAEEAMSLGAAPFSSSDPAKNEETGDPAPVVSHFFASDQQGQEDEAWQVVKTIQEERDKDPNATIAVLVRSRGHLQQIIPVLRRAGLRFQAVEIERLADRPLVRDLLSLTRALLHPADHVHWLALLRAPWCGLSLADLLILNHKRYDTPLWVRLNQPKYVEQLSLDGQHRLKKLLPVLRMALAHRRRGRLKPWIEGIWQMLGGPAYAAAPQELDDAYAFFELIRDLEQGGTLEDLSLLEKKTSELYAAVDTEADESLQIMTIHKAKGLEFDCVILPGLGRRPPPDQRALLLWQERVQANREHALLLAPIAPVQGDTDAIYGFIQRMEKQKSTFEFGRLLYVATTRARFRLYLFGQVEEMEEGLRKPGTQTFLGLLWHATALPSTVMESEHKKIKQPLSIDQTLQRLPLDWQRPESQPVQMDLPQMDLLTPSTTQKTFSLAEAKDEAKEEEGRKVGIVVHQFLQIIAEEGVDLWPLNRLAQEKNRCNSYLNRLGVEEALLASCQTQVLQSLRNILEDQRGRWLLASHPQACSEWKIHGRLKHRLVHAIIDRLFIAEGKLWIIDYKTSQLDQSLSDNALIRRYRSQLEIYAMLVKNYGGPFQGQQIALGLYFLRTARWVSWSD